MDDLPSQQVFELEDLARMMMRERGIAKGLWQLTMGYSTFGAAFADIPNNPGAFPGVVVQMSRLSLAPAPQPGALVYDARQLNPAGVHHAQAVREAAAGAVPLPHR